MAITTINRAKLHPVFSNCDTDELTNLLNSAEKYITSYTNRTYEYDEYTEVIDGEGFKYIYVSNYPIDEVTEITITDSRGNEETIDGVNFLYTQDGRISFKSNADTSYWIFPKGTSNISVTYSGGYTEEEMPDDLQEACILVALRLYSNFSSYKNPSMKSEKIGEHSYSKIDIMLPILTPQIKEMLNGYRNISAI
jgi:hypothetical protein